MKLKGVSIGLSVFGFLCGLGLLSPAAWALSWEQVTRFLGKDDPGETGVGGSRPVAGLCLLSPSDNQRVWHTRPLFVWQGLTDLVGVSPADTNPELLWHVEASASSEGVFQAAYAGPALEPGERYKWMFFMTPGQLESRANGLEPTALSNFEAVDLLTYVGIAADISAIEAELEDEAAGEEAIALARADYFSSKGLRADAIHEIFAVSDPSEELIAARADLVAQVCD